MNPENDEDDDERAQAVVAADDTGLVQNEIAVVRTEIERGEEGEWSTEKSPTKPV